jgi:DeoR/GlpR family transcriptional regulator of sugar metabolism
MGTKRTENEQRRIPAPAFESASQPSADGLEASFRAPHERRAYILTLLQDREFVGVRELSEVFGMTQMSVRRDLELLAGEGQLRRVRGGAVRERTQKPLRMFAVARERNRAQKLRIARSAARMIQSDSSIFFYSGTTVAEVAASIPESIRASLTVVTNSLAVIDEVGAWPSPHLVAVGGLYLPDYLAFVGPQAVRSVSEFNVDVAVVGADGLSADTGLTIANQLISEVGAAMINRARRTIVVADSSKLGHRGFTAIVPVEAVDVLVTDEDADEREVAALRDHGLKVVVV